MQSCTLMLASSTHSNSRELRNAGFGPSAASDEALAKTQLMSLPSNWASTTKAWLGRPCPRRTWHTCRHRGISPPQRATKAPPEPSCRPSMAVNSWKLAFRTFCNSSASSKGKMRSAQGSKAVKWLVHTIIWTKRPLLRTVSAFRVLDHVGSSVVPVAVSCARATWASASTSASRAAGCRSRGSPRTIRSSRTGAKLPALSGSGSNPCARIGFRTTSTTSVLS
mmetsp:Transcript_37664/g.108304  ORF Transcript_37664/g.108304 Transcript_37664/m.108304 type:complete len:223 (-) Transcript_37664:388-1056(-)